MVVGFNLHLLHMQPPSGKGDKRRCLADIMARPSSLECNDCVPQARQRPYREIWAVLLWLTCTHLCVIQQPLHGMSSLTLRFRYCAWPWEFFMWISKQPRMRRAKSKFKDKSLHGPLLTGQFSRFCMKKWISPSLFWDVNLTRLWM